VIRAHGSRHLLVGHKSIWPSLRPLTLTGGRTLSLRLHNATGQQVRGGVRGVPPKMFVLFGSLSDYRPVLNPSYLIALSRRQAIFVASPCNVDFDPLSMGLYWERRQSLEV